MTSKLLLASLILGISLSANAQTQKKLVHKRPPAPSAPPIDMNPPKTTETNTQDQNQGSEFFHQAAAETYEVLGGLEYANAKASFSSSAAPVTSAQVTSIAAQVQAEYGFTHNIAAGITLAYDWSWTALSPDGSQPNHHTVGMVDPSLYIKGRIDFESSSLRLGGNLNISLAKAYEDGNGNENAYSGGQSLEPIIGYEWYLSDNTLGLGAKYKLFLGNRSQNLVDPADGVDTTADLSGGNQLTLAGFYEYNFYPMKVGVDFEAQFQDSTTRTATGFTITPIDATSTYRADVYLPILFTDSFTLLPKASVGWVAGHSVVDTTSVWGATLIARYAF